MRTSHFSRIPLRGAPTKHPVYLDFPLIPYFSLNRIAFFCKIRKDTLLSQAIMQEVIVHIQHLTPFVRRFPRRPSRA